MTGGHQLKARHVIHTVGPIYRGGRANEAELLGSCYRESLRLATEAGLETVAFPCISTGVYGYPSEEACAIAVAAVTEWLEKHELPRAVTFCCFNAGDADLYRARLGSLNVLGSRTAELSHPSITHRTTAHVLQLPAHFAPWLRPVAQ